MVYAIILPVLVLKAFECGASQAQREQISTAKSDPEVGKGVFWTPFVNSLRAYPRVILGLVGMSIPGIAVKGAELSPPEPAVKPLLPGWWESS